MARAGRRPSQRGSVVAAGTGRGGGGSPRGSIYDDCAPQEMAGRALKQTGSRSIEAALDYISKMGYLDPRNEQIVRVVRQTSPGECGRRPAGRRASETRRSPSSRRRAGLG